MHHSLDISLVDMLHRIREQEVRTCKLEIERDALKFKYDDLLKQVSVLTRLLRQNPTYSNFLDVQQYLDE
jgi:hypothetical protein